MGVVISSQELASSSASNTVAGFIPLFLSVICVGSGSASFYHPGHSILVSENAGSRSELHVQKRQAAGGRCERLTLNELCTNGFYQEYASLAVRCNDPTIATGFLREYCSRNSLGDYCYFLENNYDTLVTNACNSSLTTCTPACRRLLAAIRTRLGCCISIFNDSTSVFAHLRPFRNSLWSLCGVEPVTEQCTSSIDLTGIQADKTCTLQAYNQLIYTDVTCRRENVESTRRALTSVGCRDDIFYSQMRQSCAVNENGQYCQTLPLQSSRFEARASAACEDTSVCDTHCIETLKDITSAVGCCFVDEFNSTSDEIPDWMSFEYWQRCNLVSPGFCNARFSSAASYNSRYSIIFSTAAIVWAIFK